MNCLSVSGLRITDQRYGERKSEIYQPFSATYIHSVKVTMSYRCYMCNEIVIGDVRCLLSHLRSVHFVCERRGITLKCGQGDCVRCYKSFNSLARHLHNQHPGNISAISQVVSHIDSSSAGQDSPGVADSGNFEPTLPTAPVRQFDSNQAAATFLASLLSSSSVTQRTVQSVIEHTSALVSDIVQDISNDVISTLRSANVLEDVDLISLQNRLQKHANPFESINTQHKWTKLFRTQFGMVEARSVFLGNRYDQCLDAASGSMRQIIRRDTFQYVPILNVIELLLSDNSIFRETVRDRVSVDGVMCDFCDGSLYNSNPLFVEDKSALQLCLYFDECEVANPLGSRRGIHKIGFIYMSLRNMQPMFNSRLNNIHIVAAFNSLDRSKYGFDKILAPLVRDIKQLEHGVDLTLRDGTVVHKRGTVVLLAGDNLGLNQLCGFVESFSATHFCRLCMTDKADSSSTCTDDCLQLRTREQYSQQLECLQSGTLTTKDCGIKRSCLLNDLQYFHIAENVTVDPMHDLLEGVVPFELKLILYFFIFDRKYFSLELLNARLASFDYGCIDRRNKPTALSEVELRDLQKNRLTQKAAQTMCLFVILPFLVGDKVPESENMWKLYLLLHDIIDLVFADTCSIGDSVYLKCKIEDHHTLFMSLFSSRRMLPKHHILVHYPQVMQKVGPLSLCSSIRYEAKHNESKRLCSVVCCFKDICKTVVYRHQLNQCVRIATGNHAIYEVKVEKVQVCMVNDLPEADNILSSISGLHRFDDISHCESVHVCGTEYRSKMVIVVDAGDEPSFCSILRCLVVADNIVHFVCQNLAIKYYDSHLHAYVVKTGTGLQVVDHRDLKYYKPQCLRHMFDSSCDYVVFP